MNVFLTSPMSVHLNHIIHLTLQITRNNGDVLLGDTSFRTMLQDSPNYYLITITIRISYFKSLVRHYKLTLIPYHDIHIRPSSKGTSLYSSVNIILKHISPNLPLRRMTINNISPVIMRIS